MIKFRTVVLLAILLPLGSCWPEPMTVNTKFYIINNSSHSIELIVYLRKPPNETDSVWNLNTGEHIYSSFSIRGEIASPPPFPSDSAKIIYDDSIFIMHYRLAVQPASRSILIEDSWSGEEIDQYKYKWEYIISDADYLEALEIRK
jgi:hypothetical protein